MYYVSDNVSDMYYLYTYDYYCYHYYQHYKAGGHAL